MPVGRSDDGDVQNFRSKRRSTDVRLLKNLGFYIAMKEGLSIRVDHMIIRPEKEILLNRRAKRLRQSICNFGKGLLPPMNVRLKALVFGTVPRMRLCRLHLIAL
jgi:hypothetical protein